MEMAMVLKPQRHQPQLAAVDQSRQRQPNQVNHWTHSRRRTTASRLTPEVRKEKEAPRRKEAKKVCPPAGLTRIGTPLDLGY